MSNIITGDDALKALDAGSEEVVSNEFTRLKSGGKFIVKVPGISLISAFVYGNFENPKIYSFVAENESKKSAKGFPIGELTPFDKAYIYYKDQSDDWLDEMSAKANVFKSDQKFTFGFFDLDSGEPIKVEFTKNQGQSIRDAIVKNEKYLDKFAFELSKTGTSRSTVVSLTLIPMLDELTDKQRENFEKLPSEFDAKNFENLYYVMSDEDQIEKLTEVGFDVSLIGLNTHKKDTAESNPEESEAKPIDGEEGGDISESDLPF